MVFSLLVSSHLDGDPGQVYAAGGMPLAFRQEDFLVVIASTIPGHGSYSDGDADQVPGKIL